jgi:hypothetical protein
MRAKTINEAVGLKPLKRDYEEELGLIIYKAIKDNVTAYIDSVAGDEFAQVDLDTIGFAQDEIIAELKKLQLI